MELYDLKVNHLTNPLGFKTEKTAFMWKVRGAKGKKQKAARICVADSIEKLQKGEFVIDTGFDANADSLCFPVSIDLKPYTRYYWQVTVQSDIGEEETGEVRWFETSKMNDEWAGKWITCNNEEQRHPIFEKEIAPKKSIKAARLYICGLGVYEAYINGERVGNEYLAPYCNDYNEWVQYQTFDITEQLTEKSTLSVLLGEGWYKSRIGFTSKPGDKGFYGSEWKLVAEVRLEYADGTVETIGTDDSWTVRRSNILFSGIYDGEQVNDTLSEAPAEKAFFCEPPKGKLTPRMSLPVIIHENIKPVELIRTPKGEQVLDMGQNFTGIFKLHINVPKGTKIHIQTGEVMQKGCFYNENLRTAKSEYVYISDGTEKDIIPHFTFYGYRYVKIEGIPDLKKEDFTGLALYSDIEQRGDIKTGNPLLNKFVSNVRRGMKDNFLDVPTDCPQRDERMGWTGDTQVFSATAMYLADAYAFYAKYLYDMALEQKSLDGKVPDVVPAFDIKGSACVWGDAACIIPWNLYLFYGDKSILEAQFDSMRSWVDYIRRVDGNNHGWRYVFHYGDWLALDNPKDDLSDPFGGTDEEFIANIYYAASADIVSKAAGVLGKEKEEKEYKALSNEQFNAVKEEYYSKTGRCCIKTQTALLLTLKYHLSDNEELTKKQLRKLFEDNNDKLKTGFVGTSILCSVLSDNGFGDLAYKLLLNEEYPGWLNEVKLGATTVWERWNSLDENGEISGTGMNSLNHYAYGSVLEWVFSHSAGIRPVHSGFKKVIFAPEFNADIKSVEAVYDSSAGEYFSGWEIADSGTVRCKFKVPFNGEAEIKLPHIMEKVLLTAGEYEFSFKLPQQTKG
ncbi:MAG: glycoside hydrolase family 78 protein [Firmicutes bacterium]|nr:glycoside hydrolase family 78 protein [[Eubacterium] siraeum]MCM1488671.1 glycoside hydrolase family 78 protein [Bacillota bacterium]